MDWFKSNILKVGLSVSAFIVSIAVLSIVVLEWYKQVG